MVSCGKFHVLAKVGFDFGAFESYGNLQYAIHAVAIVAMILANVMMYRYFILSMHENGAAQAGVFNFAVNYITSVFIGYYAFGETVTARLLLGLTFVLSGSALIGMCREADEKKMDKIAEKGV